MIGGSGGAPRTLPLAARVPLGLWPGVGLLLGIAAGVVYWLGSHVWPNSVAVVLALFTMSLLSLEVCGLDGLADRRAVLVTVFGVLTKYEVLTALSSARIGVDVPPDLVPGLLLAASSAAAYALAASLVASGAALLVALALGALPATLLGLPGWIGLAAALVGRLSFRLRGASASAENTPPGIPLNVLDTLRQLSEAWFLLGALAGWKYL